MGPEEPISINCDYLTEHFMDKISCIHFELGARLIEASEMTEGMLSDITWEIVGFVELEEMEISTI